VSVWARVLCKGALASSLPRPPQFLKGPRFSHPELFPTRTTTATPRYVVTVVGERAFGDGSLDLHEKAIALARLARLVLVRFVFGKGNDRLVGADPFPPPHDPEIEEAVLATLTGQ
jgi:hypothetical protein